VKFVKRAYDAIVPMSAEVPRRFSASNYVVGEVSAARLFGFASDRAGKDDFDRPAPLPRGGSHATVAAR
jgi:hypothetical protein